MSSDLAKLTVSEFQEGQAVFNPVGPSTPYSNLDTDVTYQRGSLGEQWTVLFKNKTSGIEAIITVKHNFRSVFLEFEVEIGPINVADD